MAGFIVRRILSSILVVVLTSVFVFVLFLKGLGNYPAVNYCSTLRNGRCPAATLKGIEHQMGEDRSVASNYLTWSKGIFVGRKHVYSDGKYYDCPAPCFGISITTSDPIWTDLKQKYPATLSVAIGGASLYLTFGVLLGCLAARWRGTALDRILVGGTLVWSAIPDYLVILFAWLIFSLKLGLFPNIGYYSVIHHPTEWFTGLALPWLTLGVTNLTDYARFTRGQMVETMGEDFVRTAQAKGARSTSVLFRHGLRAAIVPVITIFGLDFATLLSGTVFIEMIFGIDGIGHWGLQALSTPMDINVIQTTVLVGAVLIVLGNLIVDILYSFMDPRVSIA